MDLFDLFRCSLLVLVGTYVVVQTVDGVLRLWGWLHRPGREVQLLRHYLLVQLLRIPWRRFAGDVAQIGLLAAVLLLLAVLHVRWLDPWKSFTWIGPGS